VRESTLWILQIATAIILLIVVPLHLMLFSPLTGLGFWEGLKFANVISRAKDVAWLTLYLVFVPAALFHGLYGVRVILVELLSLEGRGQRVLSFTLLAVGLAAAIFGEYTALIAFLR